MEYLTPANFIQDFILKTINYIACSLQEVLQ